MWKILFTIFCIATFATVAVAQDGLKITFSLFATDLTDCDSTSACDGVVKIMCSTVSSDWKDCGKTIEMSDDNYPVWPELFDFVYNSSEHLRWKFDIVDMDVLFDDPIGTVIMPADDFLAATEGQIAVKTLIEGGRGSLYVHRRRPEE